MNTMLPITEPAPEFIGDLLRAQRSMSAIERFSMLHDAGDFPVGSLRPGRNHYQDLLPASPPGPGQQFAFEVDLDKCSGCKACVVACHTMNGLEEDEAWRRVGTVSSAGQQSRIQHVTTACHHCEAPACLSGCPVKAYEKDPHTGIVRHLDDQCIGCKYCTMMCPYEVPRYSPRLGIVRKCDMCHQRLSSGEAPACVQACPNEAITIRIVDAHNKSGEAETALGVRLAPGAPLSRLTCPTTRYKTAHLDSFTRSIPQDEAIDPVAESHWPLAVMLVATQISVGTLVAERAIAVMTVPGGQPWPAAVTRVSVLLALLIGATGLALAPLHLGQPLRAWRVFLGLRTSWLSREAVILGKYMALLAAVAVLLWMDACAEYLPAAAARIVPTASAIPAWAALATLAGAIVAGIAGMYCSAMIYVATRRHLWRAGRTMGRFFGTAFVGGLACAIVVIVTAAGGMTLARAVAAVFTLAILAKLAWEFRFQFANISGADRYDIRSGHLASGPLRRLTITRFATGISSAAMAAAFAAGASPATFIGSLVAATAIAVLLTVGELCERLLYFSSVVYDRMPGTLR